MIPALAGLHLHSTCATMLSRPRPPLYYVQAHRDQSEGAGLGRDQQGMHANPSAWRAGDGDVAADISAVLWRACHLRVVRRSVVVRCHGWSAMPGQVYSEQSEQVQSEGLLRFKSM